VLSEAVESWTSAGRFTGGLILLLTLCCLPADGAGKPERDIEEVVGVVVAYDDIKPSVTCIDVCETSLIVRVNQSTEVASGYIRIDLRFSGRRRFPNELIRSKKQWKFKVFRTTDHDERMEEFIRGEDVFGKKFEHPNWKLIPGAEDEALPFGQVLRSYSLVKNGFKPISD
jgi:hypothetical protein